MSTLEIDHNSDAGPRIGTPSPRKSAGEVLEALHAPLLPNDPVSRADEDLSDRGNAARFVALYQQKFLFVRAQGWFVYTGTHWSREGAEGAALLAAGDTAAAILDEAKALEAAAKRDTTKADGLLKRAAQLRIWSTRSGAL